MSNRMAGHELLFEGSAYDEGGRKLRNWGSTGGSGHAKCSCGKLSGLLHSGNQRKAWHRAHKEELRKESKK